MNISELKQEIRFMRWLFLFFVAVSIWTWAVDIPETREILQYYKSYHDNDYQYIHKRMANQEKIVSNLQMTSIRQKRLIYLLSAQNDILEGCIRVILAEKLSSQSRSQ